MGDLKVKRVFVLSFFFFFEMREIKHIYRRWEKPGERDKLKMGQ
jgi:hypothetical protein